jgi:transposase
VDRDALNQLSKDALIALLLAQEARIAELERRLGLNSSNSGKPPSSDGLNKPPQRVSSLRAPSGKKTGGQRGHPGETLRRVQRPDATIDHYPEACIACGKPLTAAMTTDHVARQVFDLPEPRPLIVTEQCVWLPVRRLRHADSGGIPRRGDRAGAIRRTHQRVRAVSAALPVAA